MLCKEAVAALKYLPPDVIALEQKFINALGTKVSMKGSLERGSLVVEFFSREDLDRIYDLLIKE